MSRYFITSDTHFGHNAIIPHCKRPFLSVEQMDFMLIRNWNFVVSKKDIVYHLGDFCWINKRDTLLHIRKQLNGRIILIKGNHDTASKKVYQEVFDEYYPNPVILGNTILSHKPMPAPAPYKNIHGHVHNIGHEDILVTERHINVCVEVTNYRPVELSKYETVLK